MSDSKEHELEKKLKEKKKKEKEKEKQLEEKKEKEKIEETNQDEILTMLAELKACTDKDISLDERCKQVTELLGISEIVGITTLDDKVKKETLERIRNEIGYSKEMIQRDTLTPSKVIENTSALKGIYYTKDIKDLSKERNQLLNVDKNVQFKSPKIPQTDKVTEFDQKSQRDKFHREMNMLGCGVAFDHTVAVLGFGIGVGLARDTKQQHEDDAFETRSRTYFSKMSSSFVPVKLWEPNLSQLSLCQTALSALVDIEKLLSLENTLEAQERCQDFFCNFGSHFYTGDVHFGGIYATETFYKSDTQTDKSHAKRMVETIHNAILKVKKQIFGVKNIGAQLSVDHHKGSATSESNYTCKECTDVHIQESKWGGPLEVNTMQLWKKGLINCNFTWVIVDRGLWQNDKCIGVWDIVTNQSSQFEDHEKLSSFLKQKWHMFTGIETNDDVQRTSTLSESKKIDDLIEEKAKQLKDDDSAKSYMSVVHELNQMVRAITNKLGENKLWEYQLKNNSNVKDIFRRVSSLQFEELDRIQIHNDVTELLNGAGDFTFPGKQEIICWLNKTEKAEESMIDMLSFTTIEEFIYLFHADGGFLRDYRHRRDNLEGHVEDINTDLKVKFALAVVRQLNILKIKNKLDYSLFLALVVPLGFDIKEKVFMREITIDTLERFNRESSKVVQEYEQLNVTDNERRLAWILRCMLLKLPSDVTRIGKKIIIGQVINHLTSTIEIPISILNLETANDDANMDSESLTDALKHIWEGTHEGEQVISWNFFEDLPPYDFEQLTHKLANMSSDNETQIESRQIPKLMSNILQPLGLSKYFPGKISLQKVLALQDDPFEKPVNCTDIPWAMIRMLIANNIHFRENVLDDFIQTARTNSATTKEKTIADDLDTSDEEDKQLETTWLDSLNPSDVFLCIFMCCDPFLKRLVVQKLFACQVAIPLIYQDFVHDKLAFTLWPVREILATKTFDSSDSDATHHLKTISFLRIGEERLRSKSKLINGFLRDHNEEHNTFFHNDCPLGRNKRTIATGLVEASWYFPSCEDDNKNKKQSHDKEDAQQQHVEQIKYPLAVYNLRGDACKHVTQTNTLLCISQVIVLLINYKDMNNSCYVKLLSDINRNSVPVVVVTDLPPKSKLRRSYLREYREKTHYDCRNFVSTNSNEGQNINASEIKRCLTGTILSLLQDAPATCCLEEMSEQFRNDFSIDERESQCDNGKQIATSIFSQIKLFEDPSSRKDEFLPLQGKTLWHELSRKQKEQQRTGQKQKYDTAETLLNELQRIRLRQVHRCNKVPNVMARFVQELLINIENVQTLQFFLFWMRQTLDGESRAVLPKLRWALKLAFRKHEGLRSRENEIAVEQAEKTLACASFGLEHFFREIGQIFEAFMYCREHLKHKIEEKTMTILRYLPAVVAKLLLLGLPLEIMDGDAANVPLIWIKAVFKELELLQKNKTLLSISVLGVQSSGKSTLLNTMFGLEFAVSAGRCTRGIFVQLVPVDRKRSSLQFDYILVIDTEGLRAPELGLDKVHHDNELATLVIGLADVVIVNIKGETIADMENVLQIVVHALLRLKQANDKLDLNQSCIFVHQNVSAQDADKQMMQGNQKTVQKLDKMTQEVAAQEHMTHVNAFTDVIGFQHDKHVRYVPDLWYGSPPMAPVSPKYSERVVDVTKCILNDISTKHQFLKIPNTYLHLESLWKAIIAEDFVFSFRNCLEVKAYTMLESEYLRLTWNLEELKLTWCTGNVRQGIKKCKNASEVEYCARDLNLHFTKAIGEKLQEVETTLDTYLKQSDLRQHMSNWKESKRRNLQATAESLRFEVEKQIREEKEQFRHDSSTTNVQHAKEKEINEKAKLLANRLKGKHPSDEELQKQFEDLWIKWINQSFMNSHIPKQERSKQMESSMRQCIYKKFETLHNQFDKALKQLDLGKSVPIDRLKFSLDNEINTGHFSVYSLFKKDEVMLWTESSFIQQVQSVINTLFDSIDHWFSVLSTQDTQYDQTKFSQILETVRNSFLQHNDVSLRRECALTASLEAKVVIHVARYSFIKFKSLNSAYDEQHSLLLKLKKFKSHALQHFKDLVRANTEEHIASNFFCSAMTGLIQEKIQREIPAKVQGEIRLRFNHSKYFLIKVILEELAIIDDFDTFMRYITGQEVYVYCWLNYFIGKHIFQSKGSDLPLYSQWSKDSLTRLVMDVRSAANTVTQTVLQKGPSTIHHWVEEFRKQIDNEQFILTPESFQHVTDHSVMDFDNFLNCITKGLLEIEKKLIVEFGAHSQKDIKWTGSSHIQAIQAKLWGCPETCPLCHEPCLRSTKNHANEPLNKHVCIQHKPIGISGISHKKTRKLVVESCNFNVQSKSTISCGNWCKCGNKIENQVHPIREYTTYMPQWDIQPLADMSETSYWSWFMAKYKTQLAKYHNKEMPDIPKSWTMISKDEAIRSLSVSG